MTITPSILYLSVCFDSIDGPVSQAVTDHVEAALLTLRSNDESTVRAAAICALTEVGAIGDGCRFASNDDADLAIAMAPSEVEYAA